MTLNGVNVVNGSVTHDFGTLVINGGDYDISSISVRNNGVVWTPTSSSTSSKTYSLLSNGLFEILAGGIVVFSWHNQAAQAFNIEGTYAYNSSASNQPGQKLTDKIYYQIESRSEASSTFTIWVKAEDNFDLSTLDLTGVNCNPEIQEKAASVGNDYARIVVSVSRATVGSPASVYIGNVLVIYIGRIVD